MSKIQQKQRKVFKSCEFVYVRDKRGKYLRRRQLLKFMSKPTKNQSKKTKKDQQIIVLIDLAVLQSVTLLVCSTYLQWQSKQDHTQDFLSGGANSTNLHRDLPYTDRVSSQTLCQKKKLVFLAGATASPAPRYVRPC